MATPVEPTQRLGTDPPRGGSQLDPRDSAAARAFLAASVIAWAAFQGLPLLAIGLLPFGEAFPVSEYGALAVLSLLAFLFGWWMFRGIWGRRSEMPRSDAFERLLPVCAALVRLSAPVLIVAAAVAARSTAAAGYGSVDPVPRWLNLLLYVHLSLLPVILWNRDRVRRRDYLIHLVLLTAPRLLISLTGPRFFVLQAVIPIVFWEAAHRGVRLRTALLSAVGAYFILFTLLPRLRNDEASGFLHMLAGSPIALVPQAGQLGILAEVPSLLVPCEILAGVSKWDACHLRRAFEVPNEVPPRIDQAATYHARERTGLDAIGTGGNPIVEAFPDMGLTINAIWFAAIGGVCGVAFARMKRAPVWCFLLPHLSAKGLFLWRGTISEFFDRIPLVLLVYVVLMLIATRRKIAVCAT